VEGFALIKIGCRNSSSNGMQNISIDGNGVAVIDAHGKGSMFYIDTNSGLSITGVTLQNGNVQSSPSGNVGGAIMSYYGNLELVRCILKKNTAQLGGALWLNGGTATFDSCTFDENGGVIVGGAIWAANGIMTVRACTFSFNAAASVAGGAIWVDPQQSVTIRSCAFNGNAGGQGGGGAVVGTKSSSVTIISSTFKGGDSGERIDSVYNDGGATLTFACPENSTGKPVIETTEKEFLVGELPPAKKMVNCT
jgi:hypothetical protein